MRNQWCARLLVCASAAAFAACGHNPAAPDGTGIDFNFSTADVVIGDTLQLTATVRDNSGNPVPNATVTWKSLDPGIATVSADGLVTAVDFGMADIEADATVPDLAQKRSIDSWLDRTLALLSVPVHASSAKKGTARMNVKPNIVITPANPSVGVKGTLQFDVRITNKKDVVLQNLTLPKWSSSTSSVATIDAAGLATGLVKGSTTIGATVTSKSRLGNLDATDKTTLTVSDQCDGIASVPTINGGLDYLYEKDGTYGTARIHSKFNASLLTATLNRDFAIGDPGIAQWRGPFSGSASQVETMAYPTGDPYKLNSTGGAFTHSEMVVRVDLPQCTYRIVATLAYHVTRTDQENPGEEGVDIVKGDSALHKRNDAGSYFGNIPPFMPYPARTSPPFTDPKADAFVVSGFAESIESGLGDADVSFTLSAAGTNDRPQARKAPPLNLFGLVGNRVRRQ